MIFLPSSIHECISKRVTRNKSMTLDLFFTINFSIGILSSAIGLILCALTILTIIYNRVCHTVFNLLTCNTAVICATYFVFSLISSIYGLNENLAINQPACQLRAYAFVVCCTLLLYSHVTHAVSRLFFVVFYKYRSLLNWRTHWIMIIINWHLGILLPLVLLFFDDAYVYEPESRLCTCTTKKFSTSMYGIITAFIIPFNTVVIIYVNLICRSYRSTRRVHDITMGDLGVAPNMRREMRLVRNMCILLSIMLGGGVPYLCMVIWHAIASEPASHGLYILIINSIHICTSFMVGTLFALNEPVRKNAWNCCKRLLFCIPICG